MYEANGQQPKTFREYTVLSELSIPAGGRVAGDMKSADGMFAGPYEAFSDEDLTVTVTGVTLSNTNLTMEPGKQTVLSVTVLPSDASNKNVTWSSSDPAVVTVAATGKVTAVAPGTALITVTTEVCTVIVRGAATEESGYRIDSITIQGGTGSRIPAKLFIATVSVTKMGNAEDAKIILAPYTVNGQLALGLAVENLEGMEPGATLDVQIPVDNKAGNIEKLQAFVVSTGKDMRPLGDSVRYPVS